MNAVLTILSVVTLALLIFRRTIKYKRFKYVSSLASIYDRMELEIIRQNVNLKKPHIEMLKAYKNAVVNPDLLDIQILALTMLEVKRRGEINLMEQMNKVLQSMPDEFKKLVAEFDETSEKILFLSIFRVDFVLFAIKRLTAYFIKTKFRSAKRIFDDLKFIRDNDEALAYKGMSLTM